jgi:hypothetical protein
MNFYVGLDISRRKTAICAAPGCGLGHRVGDVPVPRRSSTGAVTSAADRTSGGAVADFLLANSGSGGRASPRAAPMCPAVPTNVADAKKTLANPEPSTHGPNCQFAAAQR